MPYFKALLCGVGPAGVATESHLALEAGGNAAIGVGHLQADAEGAARRVNNPVDDCDHGLERSVHGRLRDYDGALADFHLSQQCDGGKDFDTEGVELSDLDDGMLLG